MGSLRVCVSWLGCYLGPGKSNHVLLHTFCCLATTCTQLCSSIIGACVSFVFFLNGGFIDDIIFWWGFFCVACVTILFRCSHRFSFCHILSLFLDQLPIHRDLIFPRQAGY